jgi:hypothetical protein
MRLVRAVLLLAAAAGCGGRSTSSVTAAPAETLACERAVAWQLDLAGERQYSLDHLVPVRGGYVLSGRRFVEARDSSVVLKVDENGALVWEQPLEQQVTVLATLGDDIVVAGSRPVADRRHDIAVSRFADGGELRWESAFGTDDRGISMTCSWARSNRMVGRVGRGRSGNRASPSGSTGTSSRSRPCTMLRARSW